MLLVTLAVGWWEGCLTCRKLIKLDSLRWFSQCRSRMQVPMCMMRPMRCFIGLRRFVYVLRYASWLSKMPHFGGLHTLVGPMTPKFELGRDLCAMHLPPSFIILCLLVRKLFCVHTNPQTHPQTNRRCRKHPTFFDMLRSWVRISVSPWEGFEGTELSGQNLEK